MSGNIQTPSLLTPNGGVKKKKKRSNGLTQQPASLSGGYSAPSGLSNTRQSRSTSTSSNNDEKLSFNEWMNKTGSLYGSFQQQATAHENYQLYTEGKAYLNGTTNDPAGKVASDSYGAWVAQGRENGEIKTLEDFREKNPLIYDGLDAFGQPIDQGPSGIPTEAKKGEGEGTDGDKTTEPEDTSNYAKYERPDNGILDLEETETEKVLDRTKDIMNGEDAVLESLIAQQKEEREQKDLSEMGKRAQELGIAGVAQEESAAQLDGLSQVLSEEAVKANAAISQQAIDRQDAAAKAVVDIESKVKADAWKQFEALKETIDYTDDAAVKQLQEIAQKAGLGSIDIDELAREKNSSDVLKSTSAFGAYWTSNAPGFYDTATGQVDFGRVYEDPQAVKLLGDLMYAESGGLKTFDPTDPEHQKWAESKVKSLEWTELDQAGVELKQAADGYFIDNPEMDTPENRETVNDFIFLTQNGWTPKVDPNTGELVMVSNTGQVMTMADTIVKDKIGNTYNYNADGTTTVETNDGRTIVYTYDDKDDVWKGSDGSVVKDSDNIYLTDHQLTYGDVYSKSKQDGFGDTDGGTGKWKGTRYEPTEEEKLEPDSIWGLTSASSSGEGIAIMEAMDWSVVDSSTMSNVVSFLDSHGNPKTYETAMKQIAKAGKIDLLMDTIGEPVGGEATFEVHQSNEGQSWKSGGQWEVGSVVRLPGIKYPVYVVSNNQPEAEGGSYSNGFDVEFMYIDNNGKKHSIKLESYRGNIDHIGIDTIVDGVKKGKRYTEDTSYSYAELFK